MDSETRLRYAWARLAAKARPTDLALVRARLLDSLARRSGQRVHEVPYHAAMTLGDELFTEEQTGSFRGAQPARTSGDGALHGTSRFEEGDLGWLDGAVQWASHGGVRADFAGDGMVIPIPDEVTIGVAGNWGTGYWQPDSPPARVAKVMAEEQADVTIHLGGEYYAGTNKEEAEHLSSIWPRGRSLSFALSSSHAMYSGGIPFFERTLQSKPFLWQRGCSFFALVNSRWLLFGLDSAWGAPYFDFYLHGSLERLQPDFLTSTIRKFPGRRIVILSHHEPISLDGRNTTVLWRQVVEAVGRVPSYWYFAHSHNAVAYRSIQGCRARCAGHGAIPYGVATDLNGLETVSWYEQTLAGDPRLPERCLNGAATLSFDGADLLERFVGENGEVRWSADTAQIV